MPSNSEMYERGALDAEHDDLNTFYYQHYYYYRKGYDQVRRQQRGSLFANHPTWLIPLLSFLAGALTLLVIWLVVSWVLAAGSATSDRGALSDASATAEQATTPTAVPPSPTPTATSTPTPGPTLRVGGQARVVNVGNAFLRARDRPGLDQSIHVVARFPAGSSVSILEGPRQIDGINWWRISGNPGDGWSAERTADGTLLLEALP